MMRVLAISCTPVTASNPFPKLECSHPPEVHQLLPGCRILRSGGSDSLRGSSPHGLSGDWLDRTGFRRLLGYRKTDGNLGAPSRSSAIGQLLPIPDSVGG